MPSSTPAISEWKTIVVRRDEKLKTDIELAYSTVGSSSDPALLLIMGLGGSGVIWCDDFCSRLAKKGFFVIRFDNRDIGKSVHLDHIPAPATWQLLLPRWISGWKEAYTLVDMAEDAVALLGKLNIGAAHWLGTSMGGMIAQTAAIHFPEKVLSLVSSASATVPNINTPISVQLKFVKKPKSSSIDDVAAFKEWNIREVLCAGVPAEELGTYPAEDARRTAEHSVYSGGNVRQVSAIKSAPCRDDDLASLRCPVTVIHGTKDVVIPVEYGYRTAAVAGSAGLCPAGPARLVILEQMSHRLFPAIFDQLVDAVVVNRDRATRKG